MQDFNHASNYILNIRKCSCWESHPIFTLRCSIFLESLMYQFLYTLALYIYIYKLAPIGTAHLCRIRQNAGGEVENATWLNHHRYITVKHFITKPLEALKSKIPSSFAKLLLLNNWDDLTTCLLKPAPY